MRAVILFFLFLTMMPPAFAGEKELPFREDGGLTKAEYLLSAGQYSAALDTLKDVLERHPDNADAYTYRGYAYHRLGETALAVKNFRRALDIKPSHLGANKYLADIYLEEGEVSRAIEQMQVIRMTCGHTDCEELRALERAIDSHKRAGRTDKKDREKEDK